MPAASDGPVCELVEKAHKLQSPQEVAGHPAFPARRTLRLMPVVTRVSSTSPVALRMPCGSAVRLDVFVFARLAPEVRPKPGFAVAACRGHRARPKTNRFTRLVVPPTRSSRCARRSQRPSRSGPRKRRWPTPLVGRIDSDITLKALFASSAHCDKRSA